MKICLFTLFVLGSLWMLDASMFHGTYSQRVVWEAKHQADLFNNYVRRVLRNLG